jgi:hypothetical protein
MVIFYRYTLPILRHTDFQWIFWICQEIHQLPFHSQDPTGVLRQGQTLWAGWKILELQLIIQPGVVLSKYSKLPRHPQKNPW